MDIARAREALEDLLKSPNNSTATRYYVKLALSHLQDAPAYDLPIIDQMKRDHRGDK